MRSCNLIPRVEASVLMRFSKMLLDSEAANAQRSSVNMQHRDRSRLFSLVAPIARRLLVGVWVCIPASAEAQVQLGNEVLAAHNFHELAGKRVGLITNPSGVNRQLHSTIDLLRAAPGVKLVALFGAEHGINGEAPD